MTTSAITKNDPMQRTKAENLHPQRTFAKAPFINLKCYLQVDERSNYTGKAKFSKIPVYVDMAAKTIKNFDFMWRHSMKICNNTIARIY